MKAIESIVKPLSELYQTRRALSQIVDTQNEALLKLSPLFVFINEPRSKLVAPGTHTRSYYWRSDEFTGIPQLVFDALLSVLVWS